MSKKFDESRISPSRKWKTDFKDIDDSGPRLLPTFSTDDPDQLLSEQNSSLGDDNPLKELQPLQHSPNDFSSSLGDENPLKELQSFSVTCEETDQEKDQNQADFVIEADVSSLPLDTAGREASPKQYVTPDIQLTLADFGSEHEDKSNSSASSPKPIVDKTPVPTAATAKVFPGAMPTKHSAISKFKEPPEIIKIAAAPLSPEDDLFNERKQVSPELEQSLELFSDISPQKKTPRLRPPRPSKPPSVTVQSATDSDKTPTHPLMVPDTSPEEEFMCNLYKTCESKQLGVRFSKGSSFMKKQRPKSPTPSRPRSPRPKSPRPKSPQPKSPRPKSPTPSARSASEVSETGSLENKTAESVVSSETASTSSSKKQKYRAFKEKLYTKYYDWYSGRGKPKDGELDMCIQERERRPSESSDGSFLEITADDIAVIPGQENDPQTADKTSDSPNEQSIGEEPSEELAQPPKVPSSILTMGTSSLSFSKYISLQQQKHLFYSFLVCVLSVVLYFVLYYSNVFMQGLVIGVLIPVACGILFVVFKNWAKKDNVVELENTAFHCNRLRTLGVKSTLKDFFQYTETQNFGELRVKNLPYRYFKLKGSTIEAFELNAAKEQVPNPPLLTNSQIKSYGLKPIFKTDIAGWKVSIEAPPDYTVTASNMWKKKYPIWVRKPSWKPYTTDYTTSSDDVNSFYLFSSYSRYKEFWYEELRKVTRIPTDTVQPEGIPTLYENYVSYMERLFCEIPNVDDQHSPVLVVTEPAPPAEPEKAPATSPTPEAATTSQEEQQLEKTNMLDEKANMRDVAWINALFGRFVWNILNDEKWEKRIWDRITRKLSSVQTPRISSLDLRNFDLGNSVPLITKTYLPKIDNQGVWSEMDMRWAGEVSLTLVAKLRSTSVASTPVEPKNFEQMKLESDVNATPEKGGKISSKISRFIEKIEIGVTAKVTHVAGRLCVNIPPPPTDCLWYGFKTPPEFTIRLTPSLGKWLSLDYSFVTNALEKQLRIVFEETFVLPAMESIVVPGMTRDLQEKKIVPGSLDLDSLSETDPNTELLDVATYSSYSTAPSPTLI